MVPPSQGCFEVTKESKGSFSCLGGVEDCICKGLERGKVFERVEGDRKKSARGQPHKPKGARKAIVPALPSPESASAAIRTSGSSIDTTLLLR